MREVDKDFAPVFTKDRYSEEKDHVAGIPLASYGRMLETLGTSFSVSSANRTALIAAVVGAIVSVLIGLLFNVERAQDEVLESPPSSSVSQFELGDVQLPAA